ncbi:39S mitochondrial ribosomal protein L46-domain-containing protein [Crucibulum laeve]|uniref:Large ribosomal subunit protein mL46 n=1 Tax=Crucibulum laeve TaxID=68775 RepID=A0A5C3MFZ9_9AGAR|nr:39S mitochondrial ribosomal protein L46-domain-containing protein [Crucibulum laeve]
MHSRNAARCITRRLAAESPLACSFRRSLATEAQSIPESSTASSALSTAPVRSKRPPRPQISTAVVLNRSPLLTRTPSPFENAYYAYQARIRRALHNPFPYDFYFKQGSLLETRFNMEEKAREWKAFGRDFVEEEFVSEEKAAADKAAVEQLAQQEGEGEELLPRQHEADATGNRKSLDRQGKRNLYLLLQASENGKDVWRFPQGGVEKGDLLHQAAQKDLYAECGEHMDSWIVSRNPIGVYKPQQPSASAGEAQPEHAVFFFKGHILAGQVRPQGPAIKDFAWLTKQEIEPLVEKDYWEGIKDVLSDY